MRCIVPRVAVATVAQEQPLFSRRACRELVTVQPFRSVVNPRAQLLLMIMESEPCFILVDTGGKKLSGIEGEIRQR